MEKKKHADSPELIEKIKTYLSDPTLSNQEVAALIGCGLRRVVQYRKELGIPHPAHRRKITPEIDKHVQAELEAGKSLLQIAEELNLKYATLYRHFSYVKPYSWKQKYKFNNVHDESEIDPKTRFNYLKYITEFKFHYAKKFNCTVEELSRWIDTPTGQRWFARERTFGTDNPARFFGV